MDPFWAMKAEKSRMFRIGEDSKQEKIEYDFEKQEFEVKRLTRAEREKPEFKLRGDTVPVTGFFSDKKEERRNNHYSDSFLNKLTQDRDEEERFLYAKKQKKKLMKIKESLCKLLDGYEDCFARDSTKPPKPVSADLCTHEIELLEGKTLGFSPGMRRRSKEDEEFVSNMIAKLLAFGLIRRSDASFACQVHVAKAPGREKRFTVDYRPLNEITKANPFPLPRMDELLYGFCGMSVFSTLDAQRGFWQILMDKGSAHLTSFRTKEGVFEWVVMPLGLTNAPATFQQFMSSCFGDLPFVKVYIDDIIIASRNHKDHVFHIEKVLQRCREKGITLKVSKCHFLKEKLKILGYFVSGAGITQDPAKLEAIQNFARPNNLRELKRFLGMLQFFRMFSAATARILVPLYELCKKNTKFVWTDRRITAFKEAKEELMKKRTLAYPDVDAKFFVSVDASDFAYGANLYQFKETIDGTMDMEQVLAYSDEWTKEELASFKVKQAVPHIVESFSKKWNKHEINYTTSEKECLAIVNALERWAHYLAPKQFEVWSDHRALQSLVRTEKPRLQRWKLRLTPFTFDLKWKAGRTMKDVDTLSRDARYKTFFADGVRGFCIETEKSTSDDSVTETFTALSFNEIECEIRADSCASEEIANLCREYCFLDLDEDKDGNPSPIVGEAEVTEEEKAHEHEIEKELKRALLMHTSNFAASQKNDKSLRRIIALVEKGKKKSYSIRDDGVLLKNGKIVVPQHEVPLILWMLHDHPMSGHVGETKLLERVRQRFFISDLKKTVRNYLKKCKCSRSKARKGKRVGRTITFSHYGPLDCLQVDLVGPFPTSNGKNLYWVTMIDRFTRCLELVAVKSREAKEVARAIFDTWVTRYGCPLVLMADNEFRSGILKELLALTKTSQIHTAPYKPSTNGLCERVHAFAQMMLQNAKMENVRDWDQYLPAIRFAIMTSRLDGFGFSPYQLLYGRNPRLPVDSLIPNDSGVPHKLREYYERQMESIKSIRDIFDYTQSKVDAKMRYKRDLSQRRRPAEFKVGDLVYHTRSYYNQDPVQRGLSKLLGKFAGPHPIVKVVNMNTFEVQVSEDETRVFNAEHLSLYKGEGLPVYRLKPRGSILDSKDLEVQSTPDLFSQENELKSEGQNPDLPLELPRPAVGKEEPPLPVVNPEIVPKSQSKRKARVLDDGSVENTQPPRKKVRFSDEAKSTSSGELRTESFVGQFLLAFENEMHAQKKVSLTMAVVKEIDEKGICTVQALKPRSIKKTNVFVPIWYRHRGPGPDDYDQRVTDRKLPKEWLPWNIYLDDKWTVTAKSRIAEAIKQPPERFTKLYGLVWDKKVKETSLPKEFAGSGLRPDRVVAPGILKKSQAPAENAKLLRRSRRVAGRP